MCNFQQDWLVGLSIALLIQPLSPACGKDCRRSYITVTSENKPTLENEIVVMDAFLLKIHLFRLCVVVLSKKDSTVQEEGLTTEGRHHLLLLPCSHMHTGVK